MCVEKYKPLLKILSHYVSIIIYELQLKSSYEKPFLTMSKLKFKKITNQNKPINF